MWDNKIYYIRVVSGTTFQVYKDRALTVPLDTSGNSGTPYVQGTNGGFIWALGLKLDPAPTNHIFNSRSSLLTNDTIYSPGYGLNDGTSVTYTTGGGIAIGGLSGGVTKFIRTAGADRFRLADNSTGWDTAVISISSFTTPASLFTTATQTFTTGRIVQYTCTGSPIVGLQNGGFYYVRFVSGTTLNLYWTSNGAINAVAADLVTVFGTLPAGIHTFRQSTIVDLTSEGEGSTHAVTTPTQIGTLDGLYDIADAAPNGDNTKFTLTNPSNSFIPQRTLAISSELSVDLFNDAIFTAGHGLVTGTPVTYNVGVGATSIGTLVDETEYYTIKISDDFFRLADSQFNAQSNIPLSLRDGNGKGAGSHEFLTASIVGAIKATGTVTANANNVAVTGTATSFASNYRGGDTFYWSYPPVTTSITRTCTFVTTTFTNTSAAPYNTSHFMSTGLSVRWNSTGAAPTNLVNQQIYYVRYLAANTFTLHPTYADAIANTNAISATGGSGTHSVTILATGNIGKGQIRYVNSNSKITLFEELDREYWNKLPITRVDTTAAAPSVVTVTFPYTPPYTFGSIINLSGTGNAELDGNDFVIATVTTSTVTFNAINNLGALAFVNSNTVGMYAYSVSPATYDINSSLLIRADSASVHRPYDGGVEIVATSTPDSKMIRQTRRYFRYQSGKGIQVSFAINFSPTVTINTIEGQGAVALIETRVPHRLTAGITITIISEASGNYNGNYSVATIVDDYSFTITLPTNKFVNATGRPEFYVGTWSDAVIRCGLFDDQNGMYFEYDGSTLYCVRRNSTKQVGGSAAVFFGQNAVFGTHTKYSSELTAGDYVVIRGQSYKVIEVTNNSLFYIQPSYRGVDANNVVISITQDEKFAQQNWNIDPCDGSGPTGYNLNINRIQMAYMDYSWYGAGKVRFGFKDTNGIVRYVHDIVHNNLETEAYLRSGNLPARYEVQTGDNPTFIPNLAHWGTSVIMDGEFQEDKAYLFSVISNPILATSVTSTTTAVTTVSTQNVAESNQFIPSTSIPGQSIFFAYNNNRELIGEVGYALQITTHNDLYYTIPANAPLANTSQSPLRTGTIAVPATSSRVTQQLGSSPYLKDVIVGFRTQGANIVPVRRNLLIINKSPANATTNNGSVTATLNYDFTQFVPLLSVRLAPSVDNGVAAGLGLREIINRMQLTLQSLDVLATHECEFQLVFNATLDNLTWQNVASPSLSQVIYHSTNDTITGGSIVYTFLSPAAATQANGSASNAQRELASTTIDLRNVATLGNSILGGDGVYPDGPDVVTLRFRYIGLPGLIGVGTTVGQAVAPFRIGARLSWAESQA